MATIHNSRDSRSYLALRVLGTVHQRWQPDLAQHRRVERIVRLTTIVCLAILLPAICVNGQDDSDYAELQWEISAPANVFSSAFRAMGYDEISSHHLGQRAWKAWRGLDADAPLPPNAIRMREEWMKRWAESNILELLAFAFESTGDLSSEAAQTMAEKAWLKLNGLIPDDAIPTAGSMVLDYQRASQYALQRFIRVLTPSPEQEHAIRVAHGQYLDELTERIHELFERHRVQRQEIEKRLAADPIFQEENPDELIRRARMRFEAYHESKSAGGLISITAYSHDENRDQTLLSNIKFRDAAAAARTEGFDAWIRTIQRMLTRKQLEKMGAAENAYAVGFSIVTETGTIPIRQHVETHVDVRMMLDPEIDAFGFMPQRVAQFRESIPDFVPFSPNVGAGIEEAIERYEADWVVTLTTGPQDEGMNAVYRLTYSIFEPTHVLESEEFREQSARSFQQTLRLQQDVGELLSQEAGPEFAELWIAATNRLLHRDLYRRWRAIDISLEFDEVIDRQQMQEQVDHKLLDALESLRSMYILERDATERKLLAGSLAVAEVAWQGRGASSQARYNAFVRDYREPLAAAAARRDWYRQQIRVHLGDMQ